MGSLVANDVSRLVTMEVTSFCECVAKDTSVRQKASAYAIDFVRKLNKKKHLWPGIPSRWKL